MFQYLFVLTNKCGKVMFHKMGHICDSLDESWEDFKHFHKGRYSYIYRNIDQLERNYHILRYTNPRKIFLAETEIIENIPFFRITASPRNMKDVSDTLEVFHFDDNTIPYFRIDEF